MKEIKTLKDLMQRRKELGEKLIKPPFWGDGHYITSEGYFVMGDDERLYFAPDEALKLGQFLVKFYEGADKMNWDEVDPSQLETE